MRHLLFINYVIPPQAVHTVTLGLTKDTTAAARHSEGSAGTFRLTGFIKPSPSNNISQSRRSYGDNKSAGNEWRFVPRVHKNTGDS
jgi:hypothetical protein